MKLRQRKPKKQDKYKPEQCASKDRKLLDNQVQKKLSRRKRRRTKSKYSQIQSQSDHISQTKKQKIEKKAMKNKDKQDRVFRSKHQRMFLLQVQKKQDKWKFQVLGSTGKQYNLQISSIMKCSCIDYRVKQKPCKHIFFIVTQVAKFDQLLNKLSYSIKLSAKNYKLLDAKLSERLKARIKPKQLKINLIEIGQEKDCPICYEQLLEDFSQLFNCKQCKKYLHSECLQIWIIKNSTCPLCRYDLQQQQQSQQFNVEQLNQYDPLKKLRKINI